MANKQIDLQNFGRIVINPINFKDRECETVDVTGKPLTWEKGTTTRGNWKNDEGVAVPSGSVCKKLELDGENFVQQKMTPTKEVSSEDIEQLEDNTQIYSAIDRKLYSVFTENEKLKDLLLKDRKSLRFPFVAGNGFKMYEGVLTAWQDKIILVGCRGDMNEALKMYSDDIVDIQIEMIPDKPQARKVMKALAVARY